MSHPVCRVQCPQCGKWWNIPAYSNRLCDCHLICENGEREEDCSVSEYNWSGDFGWPEGAHTGAKDRGDDKRNATGYCSTHSKYVYKVPVWITDPPFSWKEYFKNRLPRNQRMFRQR